MPRETPAAIVDAYVDDLEAQGLVPNDARVVKLLEQRGLTPDHCPLVSVSLSDGAFSAAATTEYGQRTLTLTTAYHVSVALGVETGGVGDEDAAREAVLKLEDIINRLEELMDGGLSVDGYASIRTISYRRNRAGVYTASVTFEWTEL